MGGKTSVSNYLTLELQTRAISRVPENGEDRFNENKIARVDVFFFDKGDEASCLYAQTGLIPQGNTLQVELDRDILQDGNYDVYAVANYDIGVTEESAKGQSLSVSNSSSLIGKGFQLFCGSHGILKCAKGSCSFNDDFPLLVVWADEKFVLWPLFAKFTSYINDCTFIEYTGLLG